MEAWLILFQNSLYAYGTIFVSMLLVAMVMPEEPALLAWGLAVGAWQLHPVLAIVAAALGVMTTDLALYCLGRFGGRRLLRRLGLNGWLSPQRQQALEKRFRDSGTLWLMTARLLPFPGLRTGVFVSAGLLHYPWWRFVVFDAMFLGLVGSVLILGGYYWADAMRKWLQEFDNLRSWLVLLAMVGVALLLLWQAHHWLGKQLARRTLDKLDSPTALATAADSDAARSDISSTNEAIAHMNHPPQIPDQNLHPLETPTDRRISF
ncbi:MAG: VTT domain-containing protein [Gemmatales bacterium]|nr:VTT domain-containing protein [Gemmatales bacterium]